MLKIENPIRNDKPHPLSLGGSVSETNEVSIRKLASYRSFNEKKILKIKIQALDDGGNITITPSTSLLTKVQGVK